MWRGPALSEVEGALAREFVLLILGNYFLEASDERLPVTRSKIHLYIQNSNFRGGEWDMLYNFIFPIG